MIGSLLCRLDYNPTVKESRDPCATEVGWIYFIHIVPPSPSLNLLKICYKRAYNAMILKQVNTGAASLMIDCWLISNQQSSGAQA